MSLTTAIRKEERTIKKQIESLQERLTNIHRMAALLDGAGATGRKRHFSAATRQKMRIAAKKRWRLRKASKPS